MTLLDRLRGISEPVICVHDGRFHADELLAIAVIKVALPDRKIIINRSRDRYAWQHADLVIDCGGPNNPFDHHYSGAPIHSNSIPYASCGLILDAIEEDLQLRNQLYCDMFYSVEWDDNTVRGEIPPVGWDLKPNLLAWVPHFQPMKDTAPSEYTLRAYFDRALNMTVDIYKSVRANAIIKLHNKTQLDKNRIMIKDNFGWCTDGFTSYGHFLYTHPEVLGVVIPENGGGYTIKLARVSANDPCLKTTVPAIWCGLTDYDLERISMIKGLTYVSNSGDRIKCSNLKAVEQVLRVANSRA